MSKKDIDKKNELYMEVKALDEQIKSMNAHLERIDEQIAELNSNKIVLNKFSDLKVGDELKVPITSGVYINAELKSKKKLLVNVGAGMTVEKTPEQVTKILDSQLTELVKYREQVITNIKALIDKIEEIQKQFE